VYCKLNRGETEVCFSASKTPILQITWEFFKRAEGKMPIRVLVTSTSKNNKGSVEGVITDLASFNKFAKELLPEGYVIADV
jgi:hypothetical protein